MKEGQPIPTQVTESKTAFELAIEAKVGDTKEAFYIYMGLKSV